MSKPSARISFITQREAKKPDQIAGTFDANLSSVTNSALGQYIDLREWQLAHIEKGVKVARKGEFVSDKQAAEFFKQYDKSA